MEKENLNPSSFSERIDISKSKLSHILSGRNKPSAEVLIHILDSFQDINPRWLLLGEGSIVESKSQNQDSIEKIVVFYKNGSFKEFHRN
jgi:transcriptional regulator with XRE-family HTH domain